jgi:8-oxo-dGTP pyrophosphatase MutT (NUDIX family)
MWLMTRYGFFSIVEKPADRDGGTLTVRARVRADLEALREHALPGLGPIAEHAGTDYRFRARAARTDVSAALATLVAELDYANFKDEVAHRQGKARAAAYGKVWGVLYDLQADAAVPAKATATATATGRAIAWGGVVVDARGRALLRRPKGHFDGYVWTFPKGRPDTGETGEAAALREVREETGWQAEVTGRIDGDFVGGTSVTRFFLMRPVADHGDFDPAETSELRWATMEEAATLIGETTNAKGRRRDLAVLGAVREMLGR